MKVSFLGAGQVGGQSAYLAALNGLADVCLYDSNSGLARGKARDIGQSASFAKSPVQVWAAEDLRGTADSDVIVVTAGASRRPGMKREDLLGVNAAIVQELLLAALEHSPDAIVIMVTNPVNTLTYHAINVSGLAPRRIVGMAGLLDNARFAYFIAQALGCPHNEIDSLVLGDHGSHAVPIVSRTTVRGRNLSVWLDREKIADICRQTRDAGTEIVNFLKQGSAFHAPAAAILRMINATLNGDATLLPCSAYLEGQFGVRDIVAGVPTLLGKQGIERIVELEISETENREFMLAADALKLANETLLNLGTMRLGKVM